MRLLKVAPHDLAFVNLDADSQGPAAWLATLTLKHVGPPLIVGIKWLWLSKKMSGREEGPFCGKPGICPSDTRVTLTCGKWQLKVAKYLDEVSPIDDDTNSGFFAFRDCESNGIHGVRSLA
jgi:hypothetical protein